LDEHRIGWLSADLRDHPVGRNLIPVLEHMAGPHFFYSDTAPHDALTRRFRHRATMWRETRGVSDADLAEMIRQDGIDVLFIVAARFNDNRFGFALRRAAPIQIGFHDVATSGLPGMDYLIADSFIVPSHQRRHHSERVIRLPSFYVHEPIADAPDTSAPEARGGSGHVTFGCLGNPAKITAGAAVLWAAALREFQGSRLTLAYGDYYNNADARGRVIGLLESHGIDRMRLTVHREKRGRHAHLALYNGIDIALDTSPFSGSTTTFEALWMGVPVVTASGETAASRWTGSMLTALGLDDLIARDAHDFTRACRWALGNETLRKELRSRVARSALCNGPARARQMEKVVRALLKPASG
jgi:predicted O-linked N-acetylglucosamine transferase (SPINDLY family)